MAKTEKRHGNGVNDFVTIRAMIVFLAVIAMLSMILLDDCSFKDLNTTNSLNKVSIMKGWILVWQISNKNATELSTKDGMFLDQWYKPPCKRRIVESWKTLKKLGKQSAISSAESWWTIHRNEQDKKHTQKNDAISHTILNSFIYKILFLFLKKFSLKFNQKLTNCIVNLHCITYLVLGLFLHASLTVISPFQKFQRHIMSIWGEDDLALICM